MTQQAKTWAGPFGKAYTDRSVLSSYELDQLYTKLYGISRTELNHQFLRHLPRGARILEVGCNIGNQLLCLGNMGFYNLYGLDVQSYALRLAKDRHMASDLAAGSALRLPFEDDSFDLVFTSGVLVHIAPQDISRALAEIYRVSSHYIWGDESYATEYTQIYYREQPEMMWKADFVSLFCSQFPNLHLIREKYITYLADGKVDLMYMLEKD